MRCKAGQPPKEESEQRDLADTPCQVLDPKIVNPEAQDFSLSSDSPLRRDRIGAADPLARESRWPLQSEELPMIPNGPTRDDRQWKLTIKSRQWSVERPQGRSRCLNCDWMPATLE